MVFLSHLCGEEDYYLIPNASAYFLSHLCGEEGEEGESCGEVGSLHFLSHLCGEEVFGK